LVLFSGGTVVWKTVLLNFCIPYLIPRTLVQWNLICVGIFCLYTVLVISRQLYVFLCIKITLKCNKHLKMIHHNRRGHMIQNG
jgi:hypothetical protein